MYTVTYFTVYKKVRLAYMSYSLFDMYTVTYFKVYKKGLQASRYRLCGNRILLKVLGVSLEPTSTEQ